MFCEIINEKLIVRVRLTPNSSSCFINGIFELPSGEKFLKINVVSVPEKGKANKELVSLLAKKLKIAKSKIGIVSGELDRFKKLMIEDDDVEKLQENVVQWATKEIAGNGCKID